MRQIQVETPWFTAILSVDANGVVHTVQLTSELSLVGFTPEVLQRELQVAAFRTGWDHNLVTFTELPTAP